MLRVAVFTLRADPHAGFADDPLREFCAAHDLVGVHDHFFVQDGMPSLAVVVTYRELAVPKRVAPARALGPVPAIVKDAQAGSVDAPATDGLSAEERSLYETIRRWRNERAGREGRPAYSYLTNKQAAEVARLRPATVSQLKAISGIGEARATSFAPELLPLIAASASADPAPSAADEPGSA